MRCAALAAVVAFVACASVPELTFVDVEGDAGTARDAASDASVSPTDGAIALEGGEVEDGGVCPDAVPSGALACCGAVACVGNCSGPSCDRCVAAACASDEICCGRPNAATCVPRGTACL
jgi:hypothetical protein